MVACAPASAMTRLRRWRVASSGPAMKTRWIGTSTATPRARRISAPSLANAALSAAGLSPSSVLPNASSMSAAIACCGSLSASARLSIDAPAGRVPMVESAGAWRPPMNTSQCPSAFALSVPRSCASVWAGSAGVTGALKDCCSMNASEVWRQFSSRRVGQPSAAKRSMDCWRSVLSHGMPAPARWAARESKCSTQVSMALMTCLPELPVRRPPRLRLRSSRSRALRAPVRARGHRSARCDLWTARAPDRVRCSRAGAGSG